MPPRRADPVQSPRPLGPEQLKDLYERKARAFSRRPELAHISGALRVRLGEGLRCELDTGERDLTADLPPSDGGAGDGPRPDDLLRAALGSALAIGYRIWAARLQIPLATIAIEIASDHDARGPLLPDGDVPPGWQRLFVEVVIESNAPHEQIAHLTELAQRRCSLLSLLSPAVERVFHLRVLPIGGSAPAA